MARPVNSRSIADQGGSLLGIGIQLTVTILAFAAIGWWLDGQFGTEPWLLLAGLVFGATGGMISFIRTALNAGRSTKQTGTRDVESTGEKDLIRRDE